VTWPPLTLHDDENRRREGQDITFRVGNLADSSLVARRLVPMNYVVAAALLGQGLVLFPTWLIGDALSRGELVPLLKAWRGEVMPGRRDIHVLTTERRLRTRKVRAFLDYLRESLAPQPAWDRWR
jgi:DNA-binding transcriptional LysR family regulator